MTTPIPSPPKLWHLECPCCGDDGAIPDADGYFVDGQPLICGCSGWVSVGEDDVWINNGDEPCPAGAKCYDHPDPVSPVQPRKSYGLTFI